MTANSLQNRSTSIAGDYMLNFYAEKISIKIPTWRSEKHAYNFTNFFLAVFYAIQLFQRFIQMLFRKTFEIWFSQIRISMQTFCDWSEVSPYFYDNRKSFPHKLLIFAKILQIYWITSRVETLLGKCDGLEVRTKTVIYV